METKEYRLTDICDFQGGTQPPKEEWINEPRAGFVRMLQIRDFTQGKEEHIAYVKDTKKLNKCEEDDILIGRYGASVGKILTGLAGAFNVAIIKTIPNEELLSKRYLYYVLTGTDFQNFILNIGARAAQAGFNKNDLSLFKLHIPASLEDQERIADVLEKAQHLISKREQSIDLLDEFLKMKYLEMFGDPLTNNMKLPMDELDNLADVLTGHPFKSENYTDSLSGIRLCGGFIIMPERIQWEDSKRWPHKEIDGLENYFLQERDIVLAMDRPWISSGFKIGQVDKEGIPSLLIQRTARIRAKKINQNFLYYSLRNRAFKIHCKPTETTVPHISPRDIKSYKILCPPPALQERFSSIVDQSLKIKLLLIESKSELTKTLNTLSHKALKGELTVIEKVVFEGAKRVQSKIRGEVVVIDKINKELEEFHRNQPHTGAPDEIDNTIRQLEAELKIKGEIPFWEEYVKYRIVKGKFKEAFTFDQLWEEITKFPFETVPEYDEVATLLFKWLSEENAFIRQQFNESTKQIELIVNETAKA
ncbi:type I restriction enzyme S subunit [Algoriphagus boseongensis]|uniref:Type I restriction enzyme S subunit n=1 Tax=Algoriphagus boseongensis TaxID=1442587 RepID=A0A4R6T9I7_9BACT|nr:restriction endonuclease subunit S [Algoriphagus boseongensis]TDQ18899.1 type I restriction enzyme S subunit [Algoriphagus boseongensis]